MKSKWVSWTLSNIFPINPVWRNVWSSHVPMTLAEIWKRELYLSIQIDSVKLNHSDNYSILIHSSKKRNISFRRCSTLWILSLRMLATTHYKKPPCQRLIFSSKLFMSNHFRIELPEQATWGLAGDSSFEIWAYGEGILHPVRTGW